MMAPATIELIFGLLEVLLRVMGLLMVAGTLFLVSLHNVAARSSRLSVRELDRHAMTGLAIPKPAPFVQRSTRMAGKRAARRAA